MQIFHGRTADDVWLEAARYFAERGLQQVQGSRAGDTIELLGGVFEIEEPTQRWTVSRVPALNPAFALAEVVWIMGGRNDASFLNFWNPKLPQFAGHTKKYHGAYGHRLRVARGIDQLTRAYEALKGNPQSRQVVLEIWDAASDMPRRKGIPASPDIPCNICSLLKVRDGRLEWTQVLRSNDLILGVPHNFVQFTMLQEVLAAWLGLRVGTYRHYADCLHVYSRDWRHLQNVQKVEVDAPVKPLIFTKQESDAYFAELSKRMDKMIESRLTPRKLQNLVFKPGLTDGLQDWLLILAADCARRKGWRDLASEFSILCSDAQLGQLWQNWIQRSGMPLRNVGGVERPSLIQQLLPLKLA